MMVKYHIGTLDQASRAILAEGPIEESSSEPRPIFLQSKAWTKAILSEKKIISADTRIFRFILEHPEQQIGLPIGQHLMMRLQDPVTRDAIIRSYTPMSEGTDKGILDILIKVYFDTKERPGGKMTQALESLPLGHFVDFKGPTGKFEYLGDGNCTIKGEARFIKRFIMICGGSGITPIFQVLRAVLQNDEDPTKCLVLDGNRLEEDILCRDEIDTLIEGRDHKCKLIHTLSKPTDDWKGLKGRVGKKLLDKEVGAYGTTGFENGEELVLICGPGTMETSVHGLLNKMGWKDENLLFF
jgi:nitrate reductase (NAD(P)H)